MKKFLIFGITLVLLLGCAKKQVMPQEEPKQKEVMDDEQLFELLSATIEEQKLLDPLTDKPGAYIFWSNGNFQIFMMNETKRIEIELKRGDISKSTAAFSVLDQLFVYEKDGARKEGVFSFWLADGKLSVSAGDMDHYASSFLYQDGTLEFAEDYGYPAKKSIDEFEPVWIEALAHAVQQKLQEYDSQIKTMYQVLDVMRETMAQHDTEFARGVHSTFVTSTEEYNRKLDELLGPLWGQCTFHTNPEKQESYYKTVSALDKETKDFSKPSEAAMNAKMASAILVMSELYYHNDGTFVSSYTNKEIPNFAVPKEIQKDKYYYAVGFPEKYAKLQQELFPGSEPFELTNEIRPYGFSALQFELDRGYVLFDTPEGDGPGSRSTERMILNTEKTGDTIVADIAFYDIWNEYIEDEKGNTYRYSNCEESSLYYPSLILKHQDTFARRRVTLRNQGNRYLEIVSMQTIE